jgi:hypothetical protein
MNCILSSGRPCDRAFLRSSLRNFLASLDVRLDGIGTTYSFITQLQTKIRSIRDHRNDRLDLFYRYSLKQSQINEILPIESGKLDISYLSAVISLITLDQTKTRSIRDHGNDPHSLLYPFSHISSQTNEKMSNDSGKLSSKSPSAKPTRAAG